MKSLTLNAVVWLAFIGGAALATAPVWRVYAFGFNPTLDQALQLSNCGGKALPSEIRKEAN